MLKTLALASTLAVIGVAGGASTAAAAPVTYTITFDGYCDGMTLNLYSGIYTTGVSTGCLSGVDQGLQTSVNKFSGLVVTGNQNNAPSLYTYSLNLKNHHFGVYTSDGSHYAKINSGTFSLGAPAAAAGNLKSTISQ